MYKKKVSSIGYNCLQDFYVIGWSILVVGFHHSNAGQNSHALVDSAKNGVFSVQPMSLSKCKKELASICVWACISHRQNTCPFTRQKKAMIICNSKDNNSCVTTHVECCVSCITQQQVGMQT